LHGLIDGAVLVSAAISETCEGIKLFHPGFARKEAKKGPPALVQID
jgi:hypothetical protein